MAIRIPDEQSLAALGPKEFANEVQLQRFFEDHVASLCGLRLVSSSVRGRHRLGSIDSTAINGEGAPVIIEYKWDRVDGDVIQQLLRYERWFLNHRERFDAEALAKWDQRKSNVAKPQLVAVGYRFHRTAAVDFGRPVVCLRYGYCPDKTVSLRALDRKEVKTASVGRKPPVVSKAPYPTASGRGCKVGMLQAAPLGDTSSDGPGPLAACDAKERRLVEQGDSQAFRCPPFLSPLLLRNGTTQCEDA
jgi:hypothetical protein